MGRCDVKERNAKDQTVGMVACRMTLEVKKRKTVRVEPRTKCWRVKKEDCAWSSGKS